MNCFNFSHVSTLVKYEKDWANEREETSRSSVLGLTDGLNDLETWFKVAAHLLRKRP